MSLLSNGSSPTDFGPARHGLVLGSSFVLTELGELDFSFVSSLFELLSSVTKLVLAGRQLSKSIHSSQACCLRIRSSMRLHEVPVPPFGGQSQSAPFTKSRACLSNDTQQPTGCSYISEQDSLRLSTLIVMEYHLSPLAGALVRA